MPTGTIEERLSVLEAEVAQIKAQRIGRQNPRVIGRTNPQLIEEMIGVFANSANFDEVMRTLEADRERERQEAEWEADQAEQS